MRNQDLHPVVDRFRSTRHHLTIEDSGIGVDGVTLRKVA